MTKSKPPVFMASITHSGSLNQRMAGTFFTAATQDPELVLNYNVHPTSLLAAGCNALWCKALNTRKQYGYRWFCMVHSDVVPEPYFLDTMLSTAEMVGADLLSCVIPIKSPDGLTSTAISGPDPFTRFTRLTTTQVNDLDFPVVFDVNMAVEALKKKGYRIPPEGTPSKLLCNTGCFLVRLDREWSSRVFFTIRDQIVQLSGGLFAQITEPEDWFFSRLVAESGGRVFATKAIKIEHITSDFSYSSLNTWGHAQDPATLII